MNELCLTTVFFGTLTGDFLRYALGAGGVYLVINVILAARLHSRKIRDDSPPTAQLWREVLVSMRTVLIFATVGTSIVFGANVGIFRVYTDVQDFGLLYLVGSIALIIVIHDAYFYWAHRVMHYPKLFRLLHRLHHKSYNPSPFTSYAFDPGEALVNAVYLPLILLILPVHPVGLYIFVAHMMLRNAIGHCGYELFPANRRGRPLFGWLTTVTHHDLHHAHAGYNIGLYFSWWDRWMGTEHPDYLEQFARATTLHDETVVNS